MPDPIIVGRNAEKLAADRARSTASRAGPPISTQRSPTRTTRCSSMPAPPQMRAELRHKRDRGRQAHLLRKADLRRSRERAEARASSPSRAASSTASCRTSCSCPACRRSRCCGMPASSAACCRCAASSATGSSKATGSPRSARAGTTARQDGGGIILDMLCHWRYVLDNLFGEVQAVSCLGATHIPEPRRRGRQDLRRRRRRRRLRDLPARGRRDRADQLVLGTRVRRDDLVTFHVDGTHGSAVAGLTRLLDAAPRQHAAPGLEPRPAADDDFFDQWDEVPDNVVYDNGFKIAVGGVPAPRRTPERRGPRPAGRAKGVQLAELGLKSWQERRWLDVPPPGGLT